MPSHAGAVVSHPLFLPGGILIKGFLKVEGSGHPGRRLELADSLDDAALVKEHEGFRRAVDALRAQFQEFGLL